MLDPFATFKFGVRPWLEADVVQQAFVSLAAKTHPDSNQTAGSPKSFQSVTAAHQILRDPVLRLEAALQLECPDLISATDGKLFPSELPDLFMSVATLHRQISAFCGQRVKTAAAEGTAPSPLSAALLRSESFSLRSDLDQLTQKVNQHWERCKNQIRAADAVWERRTPEILRHLTSVYREMCYLKRWKSLLKEADLLLKTMC
jgi:curved DNA-binding protein CbpA